MKQVKRTRDAKFCLRCTQKEYKEICDKIESAGVSRLDYFLSLIRHGKITHYKIDTDTIHTDLMRIGNNVNQLTRHVHQTGCFDKREMIPINKSFNEMCSKLNDIVKAINKANIN